MNPFSQTPDGVAGLRGFQSAASAKASAQAQPEVKSFAILQWKQEFAWVSPAEVAMARMGPALMAGINIVEIVQR